ncbi:MAG: CPBP family intramembrane glutamic endopeptidase [Bdellovibrionota bacterium]
MKQPADKKNRLLSQDSIYSTSRAIVFIMFLAIIIPVLLAELYTFTAYYIKNPWFSAAVINSVLSLLFVIYLLVFSSKAVDYRQKPLRIFQCQSAFNQLIRKPYIAYSPAILVLVFILIGSFLTAQWGDAKRLDFGLRNYAWVFWVPIIEEIVFRCCIGNFFRKNAGIFWGSYFSVLVFALAHSMPTVSNILSLKIGVPLGPLFLALFCEIIYVGSGKLGPAITLHAVCNASVIIYSIIDARWLEWLGFLYL